MMKQSFFTLAFLFFGFTVFAQYCERLITFGKPESITPKNLLRFDEMEHNFGTRYEAEGELVHDFVFKNISSDTVYISQVRASCGCTVPSYSRKTIPPGGTDKVGIKYTQKGRPGKFVKSMTIEVTKDINRRDHSMGEEVYVVAIKGNTIPIEETKSKEETEQTTTLKPTNEDTTANTVLGSGGKKLVLSTVVESGLQAYPNPTRGTLTLKIPGGAGSQSALLQITDQLGKLILKREIELIISIQELEIDLSGNPAGIYTLSLIRPSDIQNIKVVLE